MPSIDFTLPKAFFGTEEGAAGSHFGILPSLGSSERFEVCTERSELLDVFDKRFTVVREWQGDQSAAGQPTSHDTTQEGVRQLLRWRRGRKSDRLIPVGGAQCIKPAARMKNRRVRMFIDEFGPSII